MIKLVANWPQLEKTGMPRQLNRWMQRTQRWAINMCILPFTWGLVYLCHPCPHLHPRTFWQFWGQWSCFTYCCFFCNNQHYAWHVNSKTLLCRDASYFLFSIQINTTMTKYWSREVVGTPKVGLPSKTGCASHMTSKISHDEIAKKKTYIETVEPWVVGFFLFWVILFKEYWSKRLKSRKQIKILLNECLRGCHAST